MYNVSRRTFIQLAGSTLIAAFYMPSVVIAQEDLRQYFVRDREIDFNAIKYELVPGSRTDIHLSEQEDFALRRRLDWLGLDAQLREAYKELYAKIDPDTEFLDRLKIGMSKSIDDFLNFAGIPQDEKPQFSIKTPTRIDDITYQVNAPNTIYFVGNLRSETHHVFDFAGREYPHMEGRSPLIYADSVINHFKMDGKLMFGFDYSLPIFCSTDDTLHYLVYFPTSEIMKRALKGYTLQNISKEVSSQERYDQNKVIEAHTAWENILVTALLRIWMPIFNEEREIGLKEEDIKDLFEGPILTVIGNQASLGDVVEDVPGSKALSKHINKLDPNIREAVRKSVRLYKENPAQLF